MRKLIILTEEQLKDIHHEIEQCFPNEMCGFLMEDRFIACENIHENPSKSFKIKPEDTLKYLKDCIAIVHSHSELHNKYNIIDLTTPSLSDRITQKATNKPWLIFGSNGVTITRHVQYPRVPNREYLLRPFIWSINDCYTLVQDFFRFEYDIDLLDVPYDMDYNDTAILCDTFESRITEYGFKEAKLKNVVNGDLLVFDNGGFTNNHLGIYWDGSILHQSTLSVLEPFEKYIDKYRKVLKYVG